MQVVQLFIPADGVHIGIDALAHAEVIFLQREPLPFCQRMYYLSLRAHGGHIEGYRTFITVQIVVQTGAFAHEQRRGYAAQIQCVCKLLLKIMLDEFDGDLHIVHV